MKYSKKKKRWREREKKDLFCLVVIRSFVILFRLCFFVSLSLHVNDYNRHMNRDVLKKKENICFCFCLRIYHTVHLRFRLLPCPCLQLNTRSNSIKFDVGPCTLIYKINYLKFYKKRKIYLN